MSVGILNILGILFIVIGAAFLFTQMGTKSISQLKNFQKPLAYGAGIGCLIGGFVMLFRSGPQEEKSDITKVDLKKLLK